MPRPPAAALLVLAAIVAFGLAPAITPPVSGYDPAQFPVRIERPAVQPAGYAFGIWSVIFVWLLAHGVFGVWRRAAAPGWERARPAIVASALLGIGWLATSPFAPVWATGVIVAMLGATLLAFLRAPRGAAGADRWLLSAPLGLLAGWVTAASAVSTGVVLAGYGLVSNTGAAVAMLAVALAVALVVGRMRPAEITYPAAVLWALTGIVAANWGRDAVTAWVALAAIGLLAAVTAYGLRSNPARS